MMYNNKLAVAIKTGGQILREVGETVYIPFGEEYSVFIKNLNSVRADVKITIDGDNIADGDSFVVDPHSTIDIERYLRKGNLAEGNKFKFIERTPGIENHRGIGIEDGLIRVEFRFEKLVPPALNINPYPTFVKHEWNPHDNNGIHHNNPLRSMSVNSPTVEFNTDSESILLASTSDVGITTEGSISNQVFETIDDFPLETETHVIVLRLLGKTEDNHAVVKPVGVKAKPECNKCGKRAAKYDTKFCGECGTSLQLVR